MRNWFICMTGYLLAAAAATAQPGDRTPHAREFSFTTDNDAYLFQKKDAYYTNGFFFTLRAAHEKHGAKVVQGYQLGQMIYTPFIRKTASAADIDRPYCGYLFFRYDHTLFSRTDGVFQYNAGVGEVGTASFGETVQNGYHSLLGYGRFTGWKYQVANAFGADIGATVAAPVLQNGFFKLMPAVQGNLGMNFTNEKVGVYFLFGAFENNANSVLWNARVQSRTVATKRSYELFVYWYPQLIAQQYNSTVQGGLFDKGSGNEVLKDIEPWMFQSTLGLCYAQGRWSAHIACIYQGRESVTQMNPQRYVSAQVSYRFH